MNCPRDKTPLVAAELDGATVMRCETCRGSWMARVAFDAAAEHEDDASGWLAFELWRDASRFQGAIGDLACPRCGKPMVRLAYGDAGVHLDVCPYDEGVWLDSQELESAVVELRRELARKDLGDLIAAAFEEAGEILKRDGSLAAEWNHLVRVARLIQQRVLSDHPGLRKLLLSLQGGGAFP